MNDDRIWFIWFQQNRRLDLVTITNPKNMKPTEKVHVVVILGRVHGSETPSSYVCQGKIIQCVIKCTSLFDKKIWEKLAQES